MDSKKNKAKLISDIEKGIVKLNQFVPKTMVMQKESLLGNDFLINGAPVSESQFWQELKIQCESFPNQKIEENYE